MSSLKFTAAVSWGSLSLRKQRKSMLCRKTYDLMFLIVLGGVNGLLKMRRREVALLTGAAQLLKGRTGGNPAVLRRQ